MHVLLHHLQIISDFRILLNFYSFFYTVQKIERSEANRNERASVIKLYLADTPNVFLASTPENITFSITLQSSFLISGLTGLEYLLIQLYLTVS